VLDFIYPTFDTNKGKLLEMYLKKRPDIQVMQRRGNSGIYMTIIQKTTNPKEFVENMQKFLLPLEE
ncbi:MAG: hypothetical protein Q7K42_00780, partial [Candidatus Diapherotrites archaeon]|nr:hypothetical protein [Candidatus Diapherotrites archaeon]